MSESLRMRVVEALSPFACHPEHADVAFDAMLDCLAENVVEWEQSAAHKLAEPVQESAFVAELIDQLREDRSP